MTRISISHTSRSWRSREMRRGGDRSTGPRKSTSATSPSRRCGSLHSICTCFLHPNRMPLCMCAVTMHYSPLLSVLCTQTYTHTHTHTQIYKAIIDKKMAEFGEHSSLQQPSQGGDHQQSMSSGRQRKTSHEQRGPAPEELHHGERTTHKAKGPQLLGQDSSGCTEPVCGDSGEVPQSSTGDQSHFDSVQGIKELQSAEDVVDGDRTLHRHRHKHSTRLHSRQGDSSRHKRKKRSYSKDRDSSRPSSSKRRREEKSRSSGRRMSTEEEGDRVWQGNDGAADGDKVGKDNNVRADGDKVWRGDDQRADGYRVEGDEDRKADGDRVGTSDDRKGDGGGQLERPMVGDANR